MRKIGYFLITLFTLLLIPSVKANSIDSIDVKMHIDESGNAKVVETWNMYVNEGTEVYKPIGNLGNSDLSNFKVTMDGVEFTYLDYWNINASFNDKAYHNGISSSNELCFGMTKYGSHIYTLSYDLTNVIYNTSDSQVLYWKFLNDSMNPAPKNFSVTIDSFYQFPDTLDVWGYGYKGYAYVKDGVISASNEENFNSSMYNVLLVKFPTNTFNTINSSSDYASFDDYYQKAEEGTFEYDYSNKANFFTIIISIFNTLFPILIWGVIIYAIIKANKGKNMSRYRRAKLDINTVNNFRDIPCNKNIFLAYFLSSVYEINRKKEDFLGALLLKWMREDQIRFKETEVKHLFKTETVRAFDLSKELVSENELETEMYDILRQASNDYILEPRELEKWCKNHYSKYFNWFEKINTQTVSGLRLNGGILKDVTLNKEVVSPELHVEAERLLGLKKYLLEFSRMQEKRPIEVKLWNEYLMYAQIFGIAKEVASQFEKLYPEVFENSEYGNFTYNDFIIINHISTSSYSAASSARSAAQSYSSGGGGFSSGGGGGGSFGGGSGGGCR